MKINRFEDIEIWQDARSLVKDIYQITYDNKFQKDFSLAKQMQRAAVSIMANIAEGFSRRTRKEFAQFLFIAKSSAAELQSHLYLALDLEYIANSNF